MKKMKYILLRMEGLNYRNILESEDINLIKEKFKNHVIAGCPVSNLKIVQDIPFEFKCAIKLTGEGESDDR